MLRSARTAGLVKGHRGKGCTFERPDWADRLHVRRLITRSLQSILRQAVLHDHRCLEILKLWRTTEIFGDAGMGHSMQLDSIITKKGGAQGRRVHRLEFCVDPREEEMDRQ
ncbi:hypothetical protein MGEO_19705 [Marivita geojedonensis]|uniref:Uncharacterized protein n=1 Tax=Marivita geojedonensis TaxID=1123756 RepID=A0A1X4NAF3_9RHOB|nr:hypothetical protein MGEO_19705 [Marivita geojedonensis]